MDGTEDMLVPDLISKLLVALTWNRQIKYVYSTSIQPKLTQFSRQNAFENLRKQYLKRDPDHNVLGTLEEPVEWAALGLDQKVQILWQLCEWQLVEPARFRSLLKTEEEAPSWVRHGRCLPCLLLASRPRGLGQARQHILSL